MLRKLWIRHCGRLLVASTLVVCCGLAQNWEPSKIESLAYPRGAKYGRIAGVVEMDVLVSEDGAVNEVHVTSGHPILGEVAANAVKAWIFRPVCGDAVSGKSIHMEWHFVLSGTCRSPKCRERFKMELPSKVIIEAELPKLELGGR